MPLFVAEHKHSADHCPAADSKMAPMLLRHLSAPNASKFGIKIQGEAVIDGGHTLYLILDAPDAKKVNEFMAPFAQAGSVKVQPASPCEVVVTRGKC